MADFGFLVLAIAFATAMFSITAHLAGIRLNKPPLLESGKRGALATAVLATVAAATLFYLFVVGDYSVKYVYSHSSRSLPMLYKIAGFWGGNEGSMLLWVWILSIYTAAVSHLVRGEARRLVPWATVVLLAISAFFLFVTTFVTSPFTQLSEARLDGYGLNPMLQNPGMIIHPITTYLGYVGFSVPFAFALSALINRVSGEMWIRLTRRWTLVAWLFLSIGIVTGMQWAYVELGWGGFWAWDPVENASLIPWLVGTAFFHSVMIQEKKGMLKVWNYGLIAATFVLTIFGTFLTRSGILASVHAFSQQDPFTLRLGGFVVLSLTVGSIFLLMISFWTAVSLYLIFSRIDTLGSDNGFESYISKESSFLANNLVLVATAFAVFWGTVWPLVSEAVTGTKASVGALFFNQIAAPFGLILILLTGICPLIAWRRASLRNLRSNFLIPLLVGLATMAVLVLAGVVKVGAVLAFSSSAFVVTTILIEIGRGIRVRSSVTGESTLKAAARLVLRNRRRYGGYLVHLGVIVMVVGITGAMAYTEEVTKAVNIGESIELGQYTATLQGIDTRQEPHRFVVYADLLITRGSDTIGILRPEKAYHPNSEQPTTEVGLFGGLVRDYYALLASDTQNLIDAIDGEAPLVFKIVINPLVSWIWIGSYILYAGTVLAVWPERPRSVVKKSSSKQWFCPLDVEVSR